MLRYASTDSGFEASFSRRSDAALFLGLGRNASGDLSRLGRVETVHYRLGESDPTQLKPAARAFDISRIADSVYFRAF